MSETTYYRKLRVPGRYALPPADVGLFSRASTATYLENGIVKTAAVDVPRFEAGELVLEAAAVNAVTYSEQFDNAIWAKLNSTVIPNAVAAPDGSLTADLLREDSTAAVAHYIQRTGVAVAAGTRMGFSIFAKQGPGTRYLRFALPSPMGATNRQVVVNLVAGTVVSKDAGLSVVMVPLADGLWRLCVEGVAETTGSNTWFINLHNGSTITYNGDGVSGIYLWGAQVEQGGVTSYIPTVASAGARAADAASELVHAATRGADVARAESLTLAVNGNNDLFVDSSGNLAQVQDIDACKESAQQAAQTQLAEMQYHVDRGIPNFAVLWNGHPSVAQFEAALRRELMKVTNVVDVPELSTQLIGDRVQYAVTIKTTFGTVAING